MKIDPSFDQTGGGGVEVEFMGKTRKVVPFTYRDMVSIHERIRQSWLKRLDADRSMMNLEKSRMRVEILTTPIAKWKLEQEMETGEHVPFMLLLIFGKEDKQLKEPDIISHLDKAVYDESVKNEINQAMQALLEIMRGGLDDEQTEDPDDPLDGGVSSTS